MKVISVYLVAVLAVFALVASPARAEVYDDVAAWWHFDYDISSDNLVTGISEILDQRLWGWAGGGYDATSIHGDLEWTGAAGDRPAGGQEYGGQSLYFTPQTQVDANFNTNAIPDAFKVSDLSVTGSVSLVARFRWDGHTATNSTWMYNNAFWYSEEKGFLLGMNSVGDLSLLYGQAFFNSGLRVETNTWYDMALVLTDDGTNDKVEFSTSGSRARTLFA